MSPVRLFFYGWFCRLIPETRGFAMKRALLRLCGLAVGRGARVCSSARFLGCGALEIGANTWIGQEVRISSGSVVRIGSYVDIGPQVFIGTGSHEVDPVGERSAGHGTNHSVTVCDGVWLGARSLILPGVTVGKKAVVAAGAVVIRDVPELCVVAGVPAAIKRTLSSGMHAPSTTSVPGANKASGKSTEQVQ